MEASEVEAGQEGRMSDQALKDNGGKVRLSLLPPAALVEVCRVREFGARKYEAWDWCKGRPWTEYLDAAMRHQMAWMAGEDNDPESGRSHIAHAVCSLLFILEFMQTGRGQDDRPEKGTLAAPAVSERITADRQS
jgi:hypothetical protein